MRTVKIIKANEVKEVSVETVRQAAFERLDKSVERQATEVVKQWIYQHRANKLIEEANCREFWKLH